MKNRKTILATFKPNDEKGFDFYKLEYIAKDKLHYVLRKDGSKKHYVWIKDIQVLVDLRTPFLPKEENLPHLIHPENMVCDNCLMFYADSLFVKNYGIMSWQDQLHLRNKVLSLEMQNLEIKMSISNLMRDNIFAGIYAKIKAFFKYGNREKKLKKLMKEYKIIWRS